MKTGDKVRFKDYEKCDSVSHEYDYGASTTRANKLGIAVAKRLTAKENFATIVAEESTDTHILAQYTDDLGHVGVLFFKRDVLELIEPKQEVNNQYEIY